MKILYATSEAVPFCKTGGLADVAGSLPPALAKEGTDVAVIMPLYTRIKDKFGDKLNFVCYDFVDLAWRHCYCGLFSVEQDGVTWYFIDNEQYFARPDLYGYNDDPERFAFFSRAVVRMLHHMKFWPDVIHCNDWQTALIPIYLEDDGVREEKFRSIRTTLSVHNVEYQGRSGRESLEYIFGLPAGWAEDGTIMMDGDVNLLKGAILCADAINAVSPTYASELKQAFFAHRLEGIMTQADYKLSGVLNGIDMVLYDPANDKRITKTYSVADMAGKTECKLALQREMGLAEEADTPIIAIVSRLVAHKGLDLICAVLHDMMELPVQMVVLGKGDQRFEEFFSWAAEQYPGRLGVRLDYNEALSMAIYSGADLFLMPSKSEPCGLSQMIAMRYGTVPIVRETGGLKDTVHAYQAWNNSGNGFSFANYNAHDMLHVIQEAVALYKEDPAAFAGLRQRAMEGDFSWAKSAREYLAIYNRITGQAAPAAEEAPAAPAVEEAPVEKPKRVRKTVKKAAEAVTEAVSEAVEKPKRTRKSTKKAEEAPAEEAAEKPKRTRKTAEKVEKAAEKVEKAAKTVAKKTAEAAIETVAVAGAVAAVVAEEAPKRVRKTAKKAETAADGAEKPKRTRKSTKNTAADEETK